MCTGRLAQARYDTIHSKSIICAFLFRHRAFLGDISLFGVTAHRMRIHPSFVKVFGCRCIFELATIIASMAASVPDPVDAQMESRRNCLYCMM